MYLPEHFNHAADEDFARLVTEHPLATLVLPTPEINHVPFVLREGKLLGHVARANPLADQVLTSPVNAIAVFTGPDAYISPGWYPGKAIDGRVVPTWNYVVAHVHGELRATEDVAFIRSQLQLLTDQEEAKVGGDWSIDDPPEGFVDTLMGHILGLELEIRQIESKWKLSQNRPVDAHSVREQLQKHPIKAWMDLTAP